MASGLRSILSPELLKKRRKALLKPTREAVEFAGGALHEYLTPEESIAREAGLYLPDEDDVEAIAHPAAGILARWLPGTVTDEETQDLLLLAFGLGRYVAKQVKLGWSIRRARRQQQKNAPVDHTPPVEDPAGAMVGLGGTVAGPGGIVAGPIMGGVS